MLSLQLRARAEIERRRRRARSGATFAPIGSFLSRTWIDVPTANDSLASVPFHLWPAQEQVLSVIEQERLIVILKARQLGISWLTCGVVLHACLSRPGQQWLLLSQGQLEANELLRRIALLEESHQDQVLFPRRIKENTQERTWANGSRVLSLPATRRAGRGYTASGVVLDEWAYMLWQRDVLASVKPVIDAGGKLIIISTADGYGSAYHRFWQQAEAGENGYRAVFLPWHAHPDRGPNWREAMLRQSPDAASVRREYPDTPEEAFANAVGLIFDQWSADNITEAAEYEPGAGPIYWGLDDGYAGARDSAGELTAESHPRVILLAQLKPDGHLDVFAEDYRIHALSDQHIADVASRPYEQPGYVAHGPGAAEIRGRLFAANLAPRQAAHPVEEGIKELHRWIAPDATGWRRLRVHPRCRQLRREMTQYRRDGDGRIVKAFDHGVDAARYLVWSLRHEEHALRCG